MKPAWRWPLSVLLLSLATAVGNLSGAVEKGPPSPRLLARIPADLRPEAEHYLRLEPANNAAWATLSEGDLREQVIVELATEPSLAAFILAKLPTEKSPVKLRLLAHIAHDAPWRDNSTVDAVLATRVREDPDLDVARAADRSLQALTAARFRAALQGRLAVARAAKDGAAVRALEDEDERAMVLQNGAALPDFLRRAPPLFSVLPADRSLRLVGFGDFGTGAPAQREVAAAIQRLHGEKAFDLGLTLGDNFYPDGALSLDDPRWRQWWEELYGPLGIRFYAVLGNHDWNQPNGPAAEILYSRDSPSWRMPAPYYTFTAGAVQFFALDTSDISDAQLTWLKQAIAASTQPWKVVYGHHPIYRPTEGDLGQPSYVRDRLWPILRGKVDAYLCGHLHAMGRMAVADGVHFLMAGGGGAPLAEVSATAPRTHFAAMSYGFMVLEADGHHLGFKLYDGTGALIDSETAEK